MHEHNQLLVRPPSGLHMHAHILRMRMLLSLSIKCLETLAGSGLGSLVTLVPLHSCDSLACPCAAPAALQNEIDRVNLEIGNAERDYDLNRAAELKYGTLLQLQKQLAEAEELLEREMVRCPPLLCCRIAGFRCLLSVVHTQSFAM
jgi:hypothetical protein